MKKNPAALTSERIGEQKPGVLLMCGHEDNEPQ